METKMRLNCKVCKKGDKNDSFEKHNFLASINTSLSKKNFVILIAIKRPSKNIIEKKS